MRLRRLLPMAGLCLLGAGCQIPTDPPILEQRWMLPLGEVSLAQSELIPSSVTVRGSNYDVSVDPVAASASFGTLCGVTCNPLDGMNVATPPYQGSFQVQDDLPTDVVSAVVTGGSVSVEIVNGFAFDPLVNGGTVTITVASVGGGTIGALTLDGTAGAQLPALSTTQHTVVLTGGTIDGGILTTVEVDHQGTTASVPIDLTETISMTATTDSLLVSSATVDVASLGDVTLEGESLDVDDLSSDIIDRVQTGAVLLDIENPFGVSFSGSVDIAGIIKPVDIPASATSSVEIAFEGHELRTILGTPGAMFSGSGTLGGGPAVVTPLSELVIDPTIDVTLEIGG